MQLLLLHDDVSRHELCLFTPTKTPDSHPDKCYQHVTHNHFKAKKNIFLLAENQLHLA